ncbi:hypothetical protein H4R35_006247 [Dimargaris xerosporica]|nr:hypothetical protein H4R35_006247 [Dimargaris xerosporica]
MSDWSPSSWTTKPIKQEVNFPDHDAFIRTIDKIQRLPPLVCPEEVLKLRAHLKDVALGKAFLLQGGDCAELFDYCSQEPIANKLKVLLQMSLVLIWGAGIPVVRIARMAGQYAKPRSSPYETVNGEQVMSFRGDNINGFAPTERTPDPQRLLGAYFHSAATLNYVRALVNAGMADLHDPLAWDLGHVRRPDLRREYQAILDQLLNSLQFMQTIGAENGVVSSALRSVDFYMSHEGLILEYEQALTRAHCPKLRSPSSPSSESTAPSSSSSSPTQWFNLGSHFLWIGDRTRQIGGAHVEYFRGIQNPIGIKCGPSLEPDELMRLLNVVNPDKEIGKVTLISRYGASKVRQFLPAHIAAVREAGHTVVWACDPMHGNTESAPSGVKTRHFDNILSEITQAIAIHQEAGSKLNGIHLELTGESVTGK